MVCSTYASTPHSLAVSARTESETRRPSAGRRVLGAIAALLGLLILLLVL